MSMTEKSDIATIELPDKLIKDVLFNYDVKQVIYHMDIISKRTSR